MTGSFISDETAAFIEAVQRVETTDGLLALMQKTLSGFGVSYFTLYEFTGSTEKGVLGNYPRDWGRRYAERRYEYRDPVARKLFEERKGFFWDAKRLTADGRLRGQRGRVFHEGSDFGLQEGYAHLISDLNGYAALTSFCSKLGRRRNPRHCAAMHLISTLYVWQVQGADGAAAAARRSLI